MFIRISSIHCYYRNPFFTDVNTKILSVSFMLSKIRTAFFVLKLSSDFLLECTITLIYTHFKKVSANFINI